MTEQPTPVIGKAEQRHQQTLERRRQNAADAVAAQGGASPATSHLPAPAQAFLAVVSQDLLRAGRVAFDPDGQPKVALYDPALLAPNPQRGRVIDRGLDELAESLSREGQQEPVVARLITPTDRRRWPDVFRPEQLLLILQGHRVYHAQPKSTLAMLRVELMLPEADETDVAYSRRALRRASVKMMHSQGYDIFDKVNLFLVWRQEFAIEQPKHDDVAEYFQISRSEAQRVQAVAGLDEDVAREIQRAERRPADEVVFTIANRPREEHRDAYRRYGHQTVAAVRALERSMSPTQAQAIGPGRPHNYVFRVGEGSPFTCLSTALTPQEWQRRGGAKAFWNAVRDLVNDKSVQERIERDLG